MGIKVKVSGVNAIISGLDQYSKEIQQKIGEEISDMASRIESDAIRDVPVDTGALKASIRKALGKDKLTWIVKAGGINGVDYAPYIEFGTGSRVDQAFLQEFGLVQYARQFKGSQEPFYALPPRSFLYRNARMEFEKSFATIKKIIEDSWK